MPCRVSDISLNVNAPPGIGIPGFGVPFSPIQLDLPNFALPDDLLEDLQNLMSRLQALFPSGVFKANLDTNMKNVLDFIANILSQIAPFLSFYNFIFAALRLIVCIIEVLCAIPNPFAVASKLKTLFAECLPQFLLLFPWLALIAMILALLLLIIALIQYIILLILSIIEQLIRNIRVLVLGLSLQDANATLAAAQKIASLLCFIENILAVFIAIAAIIAIIQSLAAFAGSGICDEGDEVGCCPPAICPEFIKNNFEIQVTNGTLVYYKRIGPDLSSAGLPQTLIDLLGENIVIRQERWQLYDNDSNPTYPINSIITPVLSSFFGLNTFYPDQSFSADTLPKRAPYTVDMTLFVDPSVFNPQVTGDPRTFVIKDCIVVRKPIQGLRVFNNFVIPTIGTGTLDIEGGLVFEEDGETPVQVGGEQLTLNTFIFTPGVIDTDLPVSDDGYTIQNVEFVWKPQHAALASYDLITVGCIPEVGVEKAVTNAFLQAEGVQSVLERVPDLGDLANNVTTAQECAQNAINKLRSDITTENVESFQNEIIGCLTLLEEQVTQVFCEALTEAISPFQSNFTIDTDLQFVKRPINVTVTLADAGGTNIGTNIPEDCLDSILGDSPLLKGLVTFGEVTDFEYDRENSVFTAQINSDLPGSGELRVSFDNQILTEYVPNVQFDTPSSLVERVLNYEFVDDIADETVRRDVTDVSGDGA